MEMPPKTLIANIGKAISLAYSGMHIPWIRAYIQNAADAEKEKIIKDKENQKESE